jgi:hypothetical protein
VTGNGGQDNPRAEPEGSSPDGPPGASEPETSVGRSRTGRAARLDPDTFHCDLCGAPMLNRHCKLLCLQCGYQRDCSDP